jgi:hypothetical protein
MSAGLHGRQMGHVEREVGPERPSLWALLAPLPAIRVTFHFPSFLSGFNFPTWFLEIAIAKLRSIIVLAVVAFSYLSLSSLALN